MPGAITNAQLNPEQSWMDFHPNQDVSIYRDAINKGYVYGGGDNWTGGGTPQNAFEQKAANGGVPGGTFHGGAAVTKFGRLGQGWHGDHDHKTGLFRGVLCRQCNLGLGHFKDNIKVMYEAVRYLEQHKAFAKLL